MTINNDNEEDGSIVSLAAYASATGDDPEWQEIKEKYMSSSCRICLSSVFEPAALACGHHYCERCLNQYWQTHEKPDYIVCPLCRSPAMKVEFIKKERYLSTQDLRKTFDPCYVPVSVQQSRVHSVLTMFLKLSAVMPAIYFIIKQLVPLFKSLVPLATAAGHN